MADFLLAWVLVPLELCALSTGGGLLVAALASRRGIPRAEPFPAVLVLPVGFGVVVVVASFMTNWEATAPLAGVAPVAVALAGFVAGRARIAGWWRRRRAVPWPLAAGVLPWAAIALPVALTGSAGFTGFLRITDISRQFAFIEWLRTNGRAPISFTGLDSSFLVSAYALVGSHYPGGTQSVVAAMGDLGHLDILWAYQPVLAFVAAMLGLALYALLGRAIPSRPLRAVAAIVAAQPTILYAYALSGGVKELSGAAALTLVAAVLADRRPLGWSPVVPGAVALGSAYSIFNVTILPWLGPLCVVFLAWDLLAERAWGRVAARWAGMVALAAVIAAPAVTTALSLLRAAGGAEGPEGLGNLKAAIPVWAAVGPWITADHRFPLDQGGKPTLTYVLVAVGIALVAAGVVAAVRNRDRGLVAIAVAGAVGLAYFVATTTVWLQLKAFCMTAPIALALAFSGAVWLGGHVRLLRAVGVVAAAALALGVLYGNALQYHSITLADHDRYAELLGIDARFAGQGPALVPEVDEYEEYILRDVDGSGLINPSHLRMPLNRTGVPGFQTIRDTDEIDQRFIQRFRLIIRRRNPTASRPPSDFRLVETTRNYEVWRRTGDPATIAAHYPLKGQPGERTASFCRRVTASARSIGPGARFAYSLAKRDVVAVPALPQAVPPTWKRQGDTLIADSPGRVSQDFPVPATGTYRLSLLASVGRTVRLFVDGRRLAAVRWRESYPGQMLPLTTLRLTRGTHHMVIERAGGSLLPGTGNDLAGNTRMIGPLVLDPTFERETVRTASASRLPALCRSNTRMDWLEVLRPAAR